MNKITIKLILLLIISIKCLGVDYQNSTEFGNKTANLAKMRYFLQERTGDTTALVPEFFAISNSEIKQFLGDDFAKIKEEWNLFKQNQANREDLSIDSKKNLSNIRDIINSSFDKEILLDTERQKELDDFLGKNINEALMVRSTGFEDSKEVSNAGGNESIANVKPNISLVNKAISKVLQSYFSEKSFKQRIAADEHEESLFKEPFLPVLLQVMIGEKDGEDIPVSGVIFSREPFGNTKGVVAINSTYGHGEAVVNSIYPTDSYYVLKK